jgi:hypothetical protein
MPSRKLHVVLTGHPCRPRVHHLITWTMYHRRHLYHRPTVSPPIRLCIRVKHTRCMAAVRHHLNTHPSPALPMLRSHLQYIRTLLKCHLPKLNRPWVIGHLAPDTHPILHLQVATRITMAMAPSMGINLPWLRNILRSSQTLRPSSICGTLAVSCRNWDTLLCPSNRLLNGLHKLWAPQAVPACYDYRLLTFLCFWDRSPHHASLFFVLIFNL